MPWKRPASIPVGQVWARFKGRDRDGVPGKMYQIRDMEEAYRKQCLDLMQITFLRDEPLSQRLDLKSDPESVNTVRSNWETYLDQQVSLVCFTEEDGAPQELVAFNVLFVKSRDDEEENLDNVKGELWKKVLKTLVTTETLVDIYEHYGVDKYLSASGLTVSSEHRGQNIGARMIEAREQLCKAFGIKAVSTVFTAKASQVLAAKCGYEVLATLPYEDMLKHGIDLTGITTPYAELRGVKFHFSENNNKV